MLTIFLATSTAVERVFSQGRHLLGFTRNRLNGQSIRRFMCLGSWSSHTLIKDEDLLEAIESNIKGKRERKVDQLEESNSEKE